MILCSLAFCSRFDLVYTAEIRGQSLVLLYKMIVSVCVQAGQRKRPDRFVKFFLRVIDYGDCGDCQKNNKILYKPIN